MPLVALNRMRESIIKPVSQSILNPWVLSWLLALPAAGPLSAGSPFAAIAGARIVLNPQRGFRPADSKSAPASGLAWGCELRQLALRCRSPAFAYSRQKSFVPSGQLEIRWKQRVWCIVRAESLLMGRRNPSSFPDGFSLAMIPDTACLANFQLCLWHEPRRAKCFICKTFDYYFPAIFEEDKGVELFKVSGRKRTFQGVWAGRK